MHVARGAGLALATVVAGLSLLPAPSASAATGVDTRVSSMSGITAAAATPDGSSVFAASYTAGAAPKTTLALIGTNDGGQAPTASLTLTKPGTVVALADASKPHPAGTSGTTTAVVIETSGGSWYADVSAGWQGTTAPASGSDIVSAPQAGTPKWVAIAPDASYAYVELSTGAIDVVDLTDATVVPLTTSGGANVVAANPSGGLVVGPTLPGDATPSDIGLYAGVYNSSSSSAVDVGAVEELSVSGTTAGAPSYAVLGDTGGSTQPTALTVDADGDVYVAGTGSIGVALPSDFTGTSPTSAASSVGLAVYPLSTISCGSLALDNPSAAEPAYLYCAPVRTTDLHLYRFAIPASLFDHPATLGAGLTSAVGVPVSKAPTGVWGRGTAAGAYILDGETVGYVSEASLSTQAAITGAPQPPRSVQASAVQTTDPSTGTLGAGIQVRWTMPAVDAQDVTGYAVSATAGAGTPYYCSDFTLVSGAITTPDDPAQYTCVVPGLVAGTAYTIAVQSTDAATTSAGLSSTPVLAPAPVYAGTPGATVAATAPSPNPCAAGEEHYVVPTYTVSDGGTAGGSTGSAILTWPTVNQDTCDPFTGQPLSSGVPNTTNPDGSKSAGVSFYVLSAIDTATGRAITCNAATATATSPSAQVALATCGTSAAPTAAEVPAPAASSPPEMSARISGLVAGHTYVFTVAANNSPSKPAGSSGAGTASYSANWTGVATYAVPDTDPSEKAPIPASADACGSATHTVPIMDADPSDCGWDYVAGGVVPTAYLSQAALYKSSLYTLGNPSTAAGLVPADPLDPSYSYGEPTAPSSQTITATTGSTTIAVAWQPTPNYTDHVAWGLQDVTGYTATASYTDATGRTTTKTCVTTGYRNTNCTITGLTNGTPYYVTVQARGGALGPSGYFAGFDGTTPPGSTTPVTVTPVGYPGAPTNVTASVPAITASAKAWGEATVGWVAPKDDGGSTLTAYEIVATPADPTVATPVTAYVTTDPALAADFGDDSALASLPTSYTFLPKTLSSQTTWTFTVAAHNEFAAPGQAPQDSWGPFSSASPKAQPNGAPLPPTRVKATVTPTSITASWVAPTVTGGWPIAYYAVNVYETSPPTAADPGGAASVCVFGSSTSCENQTPGCETTATTCTVTDTASQLADGRSFYVTVQAYNQAFAATSPDVPTPPSSESAPSNTVDKYGQPQPPTAITATPGNASAFVTWTPAGDPATPSPDTGEGTITGYTATATAGATTRSCTVAPPATSCNITGLTNGTPYTIGVTENNAGAASVPAYYAGTNGAIPVTPGAAPGAPTGISTSVGDQSVAIWWTAPAATGGAAITQYVATVLPGGATCTVPMPAAPTCSIAGLTDGVTYTVKVVASNSFGDSAASSAATFTPKGLPGAPTDVEAFPQDKTATVTWDAPTDNGGAAITSYEAVAEPTTPGQGALKSCTSTAPQSTGGSKTGTSTAPVPLTCDLSGLTYGAQYTVYVVGISAAGQGQKSEPSAPFTPYGAPTAPTGVVAYTDPHGPTTGDTSLHVGWTAPADDGGSPIATYTATASNGQMCVIPGTSTSCTIVGLQAGVKYTVRVVATNDLNYVSPPSAPSAPSGPASPPNVPTHVVAVADQDAITVKWRKPKTHGAPITRYVLTLEPTGRVVYVTGTQTRAVIAGLQTTGAYRVSVEAESGPTLVSGTSRLSNAVRPFARPNRVAKPHARLVRTGRTYKVIVSWVAPRNSGASITGYVIRRPGGGTMTVRPGVRRVTFTGLRRRRKYSFWVAAVNAYGRGAASPSVVVRTHA